MNAAGRLGPGSGTLRDDWKSVEQGGVFDVQGVTLGTNAWENNIMGEYVTSENVQLYIKEEDGREDWRMARVAYRAAKAARAASRGGRGREGGEGMGGGGGGGEQGGGAGRRVCGEAWEEAEYGKVAARWVLVCVCVCVCVCWCVRVHPSIHPCTRTHAHRMFVHMPHAL